MARRTKQQYGLKYPFTVDGNNGYFLDTNLTLKAKIRSIVMHLIFTPKGQKIRDPQFGTDLISSIFEPNDDVTWNNIQDAINKAVSAYLPTVYITNIEMLKNEDEQHEVFVKIQYTVQNGLKTETDSIVTSL